jgi:ketosteroid isomerase-like protein
MSMKKEEKSIEEARQEVIKSERAFAKSMANRDLEAFAYWLSEEAIFFGTEPPLRGKEAIVEYWSGFYTTPEAPFSWDPDTVEVLASKTLALSSGPVRDPEGKISGLFNSIWRQESPGQWRVIFDKGSPAPTSKTA